MCVQEKTFVKNQIPMVKRILNLAVILFFMAFPCRIFAQIEEIYWSKVILPENLEGRWYLDEKDFFLTFGEFGVDRDNQIWPYQSIKKRGDTTEITIDFRYQVVSLELILINAQQLKIRCYDNIFFPAYDMLSFTTLRRWNGKPETAIEFRELAGMTANVVTADGQRLPNTIISSQVLNDKWAQRAQRLKAFPTSLQGNWQYVLSSDEQLNITIYSNGLATRQSDMASYPVHYNELECLYHHNGTYAASFKNDRYPNDGVIWIKESGDSLTLQFFGWGIQLGQPERTYKRKRKLATTSLPPGLEKNYAFNQQIMGRFLWGNIYYSKNSIKLNSSRLTWMGNQLPVKQVYESFLAKPLGKGYKNYDVFLTDPLTHRERLVSLIFNSPSNSYNLYAFGFPRKNVEGTISTFPWVFYLPKRGDLSDKQVVILTLLAPLLLFMMVIWIFLRNRRIRRQRQQAQLALRGIRAQLNPHFLFNALASIQSLVNRNDQEGANRYLSGFSKLLRHTLYHSEQDYISLEEELAHLRQYCELEALRSPFEYTIKVAENIDVFNTEVPSMLLQPYVENAILHGLREHPGQPKLEVWIHQQGKNLRCEILDNGQGIKASQEQKKNTPEFAPKLHGMGLSAERIRLLNLRLRKKITLEVIDRQQNEKQPGTRILINIPQ